MNLSRCICVLRNVSIYHILINFKRDNKELTWDKKLHVPSGFFSATTIIIIKSVGVTLYVSNIVAASATLSPQTLRIICISSLASFNSSFRTIQLHTNLYVLTSTHLPRTDRIETLWKYHTWCLFKLDTTWEWFKWDEEASKEFEASFLYH